MKWNPIWVIIILLVIVGALTALFTSNVQPKEPKPEFTVDFVTERDGVKVYKIKYSGKADVFFTTPGGGISKY